ncbi:MAG: FtsX-like permease family protein, partial [Flavisolibacter sp.]|nr:FtsX-like permease family protein [Flavisolibacter sp.]
SKIFDQEHPIGKVVSVDKLGNFIVTGVLEKKQGKSHLYFDAYVSLSTVPGLENRGIFPRHTNDWSPFEPAYTYVLLKEGVEANQLSAVLSGISSRIYTHTGDKTFAFTQQSLRKITPGSEQLYNDNSRGSGWPKLWTEIGVALLILIAGCFNYTNLTIARALTRAKEVGIRKVAGAVRYQIFLQYIVESICIALFSLGLATILLSFILEYKPFNDGYEFMPDVRMDSTVLLLFFAFSIVTGMLSGAIPAWILSSFNPVEVLKNIRTKKLFGNISLQKTLIVFQFSLSLIIIIFLSSFYKQFSYLATVKHGFRKENIVVLPVYSENKKLLVNELNRISGVEGVAALSGSFGINVSGSVVAAASKEETAPIKVNYYYADASVVPVMDLQLVAGENLSESTSDVEEQILLNETAVQALGLESNGNAIGQTIRINDTTNARIKGVVKNFYYQGTGNAIYPLMLRSKEGEYHHLFVYIPSLNDENKIGEIEAVWKKIYPNRTFTYDWLSKQLQADTDQTATISLLGFLALITITIGSLGLLGLVVYTVETRRKEISIRKIIGASVQQLLLLLSKSFIQLLLLAGLIAMPVGYVLCRFFLQNFANRV